MNRDGLSTATLVGDVGAVRRGEAKGSAAIGFDLAVSESGTTTWVSISVYDDLAVRFGEAINTGARLAVTGRLRNRNVGGTRTIHVIATQITIEARA